MAKNQVRITQTNDYPDYFRRDSGGSVCDDYDSNVNDVTGAGVNLWSSDSDIIYLGWDSKPGSWGYRVGSTAPVIGAVTWAYSDGAAGWTAFNGSNPIQDSTNGFTCDGLIVIQDPPGAGAWGENTVDGTEAYWIKLTIASHTTTGTCLNWLRNLTLQNPLVLKPQLANGREYYDIGGTIRDTDSVLTCPTALTIDCKTRATYHAQDTYGMPNMSLLWYWWAQHDPSATLFIEDLAQTATPSLQTDAFWKDYTGRLVSVPGETESPSKMLPNGYQLNFKIQSATSIFT